MRYTLAVVPVLCFCTLVMIDVKAAEDPTRETPPRRVHLVGHEEQLLLQRIQDVIDDWDPRRLQNPYLKTITVRDANNKTVQKTVVRRPDLLEFIADADAAVALGKTLFWEMRAGSDFHRTEVNDGSGGKKFEYLGTACASCHYRNGADGRDQHTTRIPYVVWDKHQLAPKHPGAKDPTAPKYEEGEFVQLPFKPNEPLANANFQSTALIVGSQGVEPRLFKGVKDTQVGNVLHSEMSVPRTLKNYPADHLPEWGMFVEGQKVGGRGLRQITARNTPTVANAVYADRLFHDGRAESTFNGFSIFGDYDRREVIHRKGSGPGGTVRPVAIAISRAALASQAVGPIVNDVEMSYYGRTFHDLAEKLLNKHPLEFQETHANDSVLRGFFKPGTKKIDGTYADLIKRAFRPEWWDHKDKDVDLLLRDACSIGDRKGDLMTANFSLYWGLSIMLYESTLISDRTPFDAMMRGDGGPANAVWDKEKDRLGPIALDRAYTGKPLPGQKPAPPGPPLANGAAVFQFGMRVFLNRGCVDCHSGPLMSEVFDRAANREVKPPIAKTLDQILLPNAQGDALALNIALHHERTTQSIVDILRSGDSSMSVERARLHVINLERLLPEARGSTKNLRERVGKYLAGISYPGAAPANQAITINTVSARIASKLSTAEKAAVTHLGNRSFFTEDERVIQAEQLALPALVEKMRLPQAIASQRPKLPIAGGLARDPYAFYDLGFYALGVSPPRFDRGIGAPHFDDSEIFEDYTPDEVQVLGAGLIEIPDANLTELTPSLQAYVKDLRDKIQKKEVLNKLDQLKLNAVTNALPKIAEKLPAKPAPAQTANSSPASNSAYQFKSSYRSKQVAEMPKSECDPDANPSIRSDDSWNRNQFATQPQPNGHESRRADVHFWSRARRLAYYEEPWGHRKPFIHDNELAFWGAFKTPSLRNVSVTGPYMHNGRLKTLRDVIEFYDDGGFVKHSLQNNPDRHPGIVTLNMSEDEKRALEFFLICLTDSRLPAEKAPFDHPSLVVPNGYKPGTAGAIGVEVRVSIPATGGP